MVVPELTALEALGIAIRAEIDAAEVYQEFASRVDNPFLKRKVKVLVSEELQHKRILEDAYKKQFPEVPLVLPSSQLAKEISNKTRRDRLSLREILSYAIDEERRSRDFYLKAADSVTDLTGKAMFNFLADWEFSHQMELTAEYELVVHYPRYFERTVEPWRTEFRRAT